MFERELHAPLREALEDTPAVLVVGARQTGKTTLVRSVEDSRRGSTYVTLDDLSSLESATRDPVGFVRSFRGLAIIDEIQKAPILLPAIKASIDRDRRPGRFLMTGSADVLALPKVSESLAGRMEILTLWPLSQGEIAGKRVDFIDRALRGEPPLATRHRNNLEATVAAGGFPEAVARTRAPRRRALFASYVTTIVSRDVRDLSSIEDPGALHRLMQLCAVRSASLLNHTELSRTLALPVSTLKRYLSILEKLFLVREVPAWSSNHGKRLARAPKLHLADTGLLVALASLDAERLRADRQRFGAVLESFVAGELWKQLGWCEARATLHHFRTHGGQEVDLVLEDARGRVVGIEVKAAATVTSSDFSGLRALAETAGKAFVQGLVLYQGDHSLPFGKSLYACPLQSLLG